MISLDQVQLLDKKVATMVAKVSELQRANAQLRAQLKDYASKNQDLIAKNESLNAANQVLQQKISTFASDQVKIEEGILNALEKLNSMENDETNSSPLQPTDLTGQSTENMESEAIDFGSSSTEQNSQISTAPENAENTGSIFDQAGETSETENSESLQLSDEEASLMQDESEKTNNTEQKDDTSDINLEDDVFSFLSFDDTDNQNSENSDENKTLDDIF